MSDQLTAPPAPPAPVRAASWRGQVVPVLRQVVVSLVLLAATGAAAGLVWVWLWTPPTGVVLGHQWVQDERGLRGDFSGTGSYVAVATVAGLLVAFLIAVLFERAEVITLLTVLAGSVLAAWVMYRVGLALSPADPRTLAETAKDGTRLPGRLVVSGESPFRAFPGGAMLGLVIVYLGLSRRRVVQG
jgi:hypothetical protein